LTTQRRGSRLVRIVPGGNAHEPTFLLTAQRSVNGLIDPDLLALAGRYSVSSDCT